MCSWCGRDILTGQAVLIDAKRYDPVQVGHDWTWHHEACDIVQLRQQ
jgi:hypothetical protein